MTAELKEKLRQAALKRWEIAKGKKDKPEQQISHIPFDVLWNTHTRIFEELPEVDSNDAYKIIKIFYDELTKVH